MKRVSVRMPFSKEEYLASLKNQNAVYEGVTFTEKEGTPRMQITEKGDKIRIKCQFIGRASKDNGFFFGTAFSGKIQDASTGCIVRGWILTEPVVHILLAIGLGVFVWQCIRLGGFNVMPLFFAAFIVLLYRGEYKKQNVIFRYMIRAGQKVLEKNKKQTKE